MIPNFCVRVRDVFETNNLDRKFRCRDNLGTSYAAAGSDSEKEVVLIVGAQDRWYLFAVFYEKNRSSTPEERSNMKKLRYIIERTL
jgi:hypothetical protein